MTGPSRFSSFSVEAETRQYPESSLVRLRFWALVAVLYAAIQSHAFVSNSNSLGQPRRWPFSISDAVISTNVLNPSTKALRFYLARDAYSKINAAAELDALRASFDQWQSVPGTTLRFEEGGWVSSGAEVNTSDHTNVVVWAKSSTLVNGGLDDISGALSVTFPRVSSDNVILEADIVLNAVQFKWFTDFGATNAVDQFIEGTMLHEIGHFIGLDHSPVGGATMLARGAAGVNTQAGLSSDEIAAARSLYPLPDQSSQFGCVRGQVVMNGTEVFGAGVVVEDSAGNLVSGTVTRPDGRYELPALSPGIYEVRVAPLDPLASAPLARLLSGPDIALEYAKAETGFLPPAAKMVSVVAGGTNTVDFFVAKGASMFRISRIRPAARTGEEIAAINSPATSRLGERNLEVGVFSPDFPATGAVLRITGDGLSLGPSNFAPDAFPGSRPALHLISVSINVSSNATPGLRSFVVQHGTNTARANGFLEILPAVPDSNFDGLDDTFQRRYFPRFTGWSAAPKTDSDDDGLDNASEYVTGTDPTNALSVLKLRRVRLTGNGSAVLWPSVPGRRYQLFFRADLGSTAWTPTGAPATADGTTMQFLDASATNSLRFYRVLALP